MRIRYYTILVIVMLLGVSCFAEETTIQKKIEQGNGIWIYPVPSKKNIKKSELCILTEKKDKFEGDCDTLPQTYLTWIGDLNNDGIMDVILSNQWGQFRWSLDVYSIFLGAKDGSYISVRDFLLTTKLTPTKEVRNGFLVLKNKAFCGDSDGIVFEETEARVVFDPKSLTYKTVGVNEDDEDDGTVCSLNKEAIKARDTYYKQKYGDEDSETTVEPKQTSPSFNCTKASTQIEKTICGDTDANFR
jgi:hypothetical protein